jgi:fatty acid synthase
MENCTSSDFRVLEVEAGNGCMYRSVCPQALSQPWMNVSYSITDPTDNLTQEDKDLYHLTQQQWNISNPPPNIKPSNLIILQNVLHKQGNLKQILQNVTQALEQDGFLLIQEVTDSFPIMLSALYLQERLPNVEDRDKRSLYCFCNEDQWIQLFQEVGLNLLYKRSDGIMSSLFLLRKIKPRVSVSVIDVSCYNCTWFENMKLKILESANGKSEISLWLLAKSGVPNGLVGMVNCLRREMGGANIRYIL